PAHGPVHPVAARPRPALVRLRTARPPGPFRPGPDPRRPDRRHLTSPLGVPPAQPVASRDGQSVHAGSRHPRPGGTAVLATAESERLVGGRARAPADRPVAEAVLLPVLLPASVAVLSLEPVGQCVAGIVRTPVDCCGSGIWHRCPPGWSAAARAGQ